MNYRTGMMILTLAFFAAAQSMATERSKHEFSFEDLQTTISFGRIKTIDALIPLLPEAIRKNPLLVYDTRALNSHLVSPETPRVVLFNKDASLILAFTRNPGDEAIHREQDTLEIIHFDRATKKFEIGDLVFNGKQVPAPGLQNSARCVSCHGSNPRPIFQDYNAWPGFYGSFGTRGVAVKGTLEHQFLKAFLASTPSMPRYRDLDLRFIHEENTGYATPVRGYGELHDRFKFSTNLTFGALIEKLMHSRMGQRLVSHPEFAAVEAIYYYLGERTDRCAPVRDRLKEAHAALVNRTSGEFLTAKLLSRIAKQVFADHAFKENQLLQHNIASPEVDPRGVTNIPFENLAWNFNAGAPIDTKAFQDQLVLMETLFRHLGLSVEDISTTPRFPTSGIYHLTRLGKLLVDEQYFQNMIEGIEESDPTFRARFEAMSCADVRALAHTALRTLSIPSALQAGVLYR